MSDKARLIERFKDQVIVIVLKTVSDLRPDRGHELLGLCIVCGIRIEIREVRIIMYLGVVVIIRVVMVDVQDAVHIVVNDIIDDLLHAVHPVLADLIAALVHLGAPGNRDADGIEACRLDRVDHFLRRVRIAPALFIVLCRLILLRIMSLRIKGIAEVPAQLDMLDEFHAGFIRDLGLLVQRAVQNAALQHRQVDCVQLLAAVHIGICGGFNRRALGQIIDQIRNVVLIDALAQINVALAGDHADIGITACAAPDTDTDCIQRKVVQGLAHLAPALNLELVRHRVFVGNLECHDRLRIRCLHPEAVGVPVILTAARRVVAERRHGRQRFGRINRYVDPDFLNDGACRNAELCGGELHRLAAFDLYAVRQLIVIAGINAFGCLIGS